MDNPLSPMSALMSLRILPAAAAAGLLLAACGNSGSIMDSLNAHEGEVDCPAPEAAAPLPKKPATATTRPGDNAVMTPFEWNSVNDAPWPVIFNDSNKYQYPFAEKYGITPIEDVGHAFYTDKPLVRIAANKKYGLEELTHSFPYLVDNAAELLADIGQQFIDELRKEGISGYRMKVTSLLRTSYSVGKLRRVNINATDSSAHKFGTTFDISYLAFVEDPGATPADPGRLKTALAKTLFDMRRQERCMVKYESKTHCFHVTVTK